MRKLSMFVLLLAVLSTAANAAGMHKPTFRRPYLCDYTPTPWTNEYDNGITIWGSETWIGDNLVYAFEGFETANGSFDNRKIAFAKPVDFCGVYDPQCEGPDPVVLRTKWEFTIQNGVQCKTTWVSDFGSRIFFSGCSNGKSRTCTYAY